MSNTIYCTYLITYFGNKLPPKNSLTSITPFLYLGSTSITRIKNGYLGSVSSKTYNKIWKQETKENPHLFDVQIINFSDTRLEATWKELQLQRMFNVVKNPDFINKSYASLNGFCGMDVSGSNSPCFGKPKTSEHKQAISLSKTGVSLSEEHKQAISLGTLGENNPMFGHLYSEETLEKLKRPKSKEHKRHIKDTHWSNNPEIADRLSENLSKSAKELITCPYCQKTVNALNAKRWHFDRCKFLQSTQ